MASNRRYNVEEALEFVLGYSGSEYSESDVDFSDTIEDDESEAYFPECIHSLFAVIKKIKKESRPIFTVSSVANQCVSVCPALNGTTHCRIHELQ